jgi:prepilin-type N-terminal cleavage/methylation domain-containing protein
MGNRDGFTLVETVFALVILAVGILGMTSLTGSLSTTAATAEERALALQAVEHRLTLVEADPRYAKLDSLYDESAVAIPGLPGYTRVTDVSRTTTTVTGGGIIDLTTITVTVEGRFLASPLSRTLKVGAR